MEKLTEEELKKITKTTIVIEGNNDEMVVTVTFDPPPPKDAKGRVHMTAAIASAMINAFNAKCVLSDGHVAIDRLKIPQLNVEYDSKQVQISALNEITSILKEIVGSGNVHSINLDDSEANKDETVLPKSKLH